MEPFSPQFFILTLALVGVAIIVAALLSGLIDRSDVPQVGVFLALGAILGPAGLGLLDVSLDSPILRVVATLSLVLVLFTDAVSLSIAELRRHRLLAFLVLGPGTLLSAALIALAAWWLLDFSPPADGRYTLAVRDLANRGDLRLVYRLTAEPVEPDFSLSLAADSFVMEKGKSLEIAAALGGDWR